MDGLIAEHLPPPGVQILPFTSDTWFYQNFSVAMQVVPEPPVGLLAVFGLAALLAIRFLRQRHGAASIMDTGDCLAPSNEGAAGRINRR